MLKPIMSALTMIMAVMVAFLVGCSSKNSDTENIVEALEDRLTDALDFEGGTDKEGAPPEGSDSPDAPQVTALVAPRVFTPGSSFVVLLGTDFDQPDTVDKVVIHVKKSTQHILVPGELTFKPEGWTMELSGVLAKMDVAGDFTLEYAFQTKDGVTGAYRSGEVTVRPPDETAECESGPCCNGGNWVDESAPCVSGRDGNACTEDLCDAGHVCVADALADGAACFLDETLTQGSCRNTVCTAEEDGDLDAEPEPEAELETEPEQDPDGDVDLEPEAELEMEPDGDLEPDLEPELAPETEAEQDIEIPPPGFVPITAGTFIMGSPDGVNCPPDVPGCNIADYPAELGRLTTETQHKVTLTYDFELSRYEITEAEFESVIGWNPVDTHNPACDSGCGDDHPVKYVSWYDAAAYANELSLDAGMAPCYVFSAVTCTDAADVGATYMNCMNATQGGISSATVALNGVTKPQDCEGYRLPTEAEWEYAARAGSRTAFYPSDGNDGTITYTNCILDPNLDQIGWYCGNTPNGTKPIGGKESNAWGLYDMSGNLYEWVWDIWSAYDLGAVTDPTGLGTEVFRAWRGGGWANYAQDCRSASRYWSGADYRGGITGFRVARSTEIATPDGDLDAELEPEPELEPETDGDLDAELETEPDLEAESETEPDIEAPPLGFVPITAGTFIMGSPDGVNCPPDVPGCNIAEYPEELGRDASNETQHEVTLTYNFELSRYEITQGEFTAQMGWNPSYFGPNGAGEDCGDDCPMEQVSWYDAVAYANELSLDASLPPCFLLSDVVCDDFTNVGTTYMNCMNATQGGISSATVALNGVTKPQDCEGYRLPTEAEWEYAARAGSRTAFYPSNGNDGAITYTNCILDPNLDQIGWYCGNNTPSGTKPVGGKEANAFGLYDMSGNVSEWCWDSWDGSDYSPGSATDPAGLESGSYCVLRGGYWSYYANSSRSAFRSSNLPGYRYLDHGFRVARSLP